jgi:hypothetical protein
MVDHSIVLEKLGVYQRDYASGFDTMTMAMGLSDEEANEVFPNMVALAHSLGMSSSDLTSKFSAQSGQFAVFGDQGVHHFRRLVIASREVSVEMGTMLQTTKRFDEFTSGAEAVQKMNAVLGGTYLDTVTMIKTIDPVERLQLMVDGVNRSRFSLENLARMAPEQAYYARQTLAEAFGMSVDDTMKALQLGAKGFMELSENAEASFDEIEDATKFGRTTADQADILRDQVAVLGAEFFLPIREQFKETGVIIAEEFYGPMTEASAPFYRNMGEMAASGLGDFRDQAIGFAKEFTDTLGDELGAATEMINEFSLDLNFDAAATAAKGEMGKALGVSANPDITVQNLSLQIDGQQFWDLLDGRLVSMLGLGG